MSASLNSSEDGTTSKPIVKNTKKATKSRTKSIKSEEKKGGSGTIHDAGTNVDSAAKINMTANFPDSFSLGGTNNQNPDSSSSGSNTRSHQRGYAGIDARSVKIFWEQHDQSDVELSAGVCEQLAEDASYKLWELINNIKTYARHSGGMVTYDLVNEVLRDSDVPPMLGAMDSPWERIDYDGSYYFFADNIVELRDEYQKEIQITMPLGADFVCSWPVEEKNMDYLEKYIPSIIYGTLYADTEALDTVLSEVASSIIMGPSYRVLLKKIIQILAFKQTDAISLRCWALLRALSINPYTRDIDCRMEYFHLAEILICQLLAPYEKIKVHSEKSEPNSNAQSTNVDTAATAAEAETATATESTFNAQSINTEITGMEIDDVEEKPLLNQELKNEFKNDDEEMSGVEQSNAESQPLAEVKIYKLATHDDDDDDDEEQLKSTANNAMTSAYFASPVDWLHVDALCQTIGQIAAGNGFFQSECIFNVVRRLERFFDGRNVSTEREYNFISRAVRCLISLGDYAFREFIPFVYKFKPDNVPFNLWHHFAPAALFLNGSSDIFLYEWLELLCGAEKLQPFLIYYAHYHEKLLLYRFIHRRLSTYKIYPKCGVRRLEWSTLAAAMCHGDDPNKALKPRPGISDYFPELCVPNLQLNRAGIIRFKFSGCRPTLIKPKICEIAKNTPTPKTTTASADPAAATTTLLQKDILIARRKLFKPLTDERRVVPLSSYYFLRI